MDHDCSLAWLDWFRGDPVRGIFRLRRDAGKRSSHKKTVKMTQPA
jgi:hypothetical protein